MTAKSRMAVERLFEATPLVHPHVLDAYEKAVGVLKRHQIPHRLVGGLALNMLGVGRPTGDVDIVVPKGLWHKALKLLSPLATDSQGLYLGLEDEPEGGMALAGPHGVYIELWPEGTTHGEIARLRGYSKRHPAGHMAFSLGGDGLVGLINSKLASHLSATDRLKDAADVQRLIQKLKLPAEFKAKLDRRVQGEYQRLWRSAQPS
jgi:hypothetical protein